MGQIISVIIPTCDRVHLLKRAVESVLNQSFVDFEIIIVDDHSNDSTLDYLDSIRDKRVRFIARSERGGGAVARNTGILAANGEYVAFLDDDDVWHPSKLQRQVELIQLQPEVGLVYAGAVHMYLEGGNRFKKFTPKFRGNIFKKLLERNVIGTTSSIMVRRKALDEIGGFDESFPSCQDWDLYLRLTKNWSVDFVEEPQLNYYLHPVRITSNESARLAGHKMILDKYRFEIEKYCNILSQHNFVIGRLCCQSGRYVEGRRMLLKAVRENPLNVVVYKHLFPILFGGKLYQGLLLAQRQFKKRFFQRYRFAWQEKELGLDK